MISVNNLSLIYPSRKLFENINIKFTPGNCYGVIGANGAGKSTFLKILAGEIESTKGEVIIDKNVRLSVLEQDHFAYDEFLVIDTVIMGHKRLHNIMHEKEKLYSKSDFTEEDGIIAGELEAEFAELNGWEAEATAARLLNDLGVPVSLHNKLMKDLSGKEKVKVLLAQSLFGDPDILLMDEPTNDLDFKAKNWLEDFLIDYDKTVIVVSHDRHFLNKVCTHMVDVDFGTAKLYPGNYDFWYESSQLMLKLTKEANKKKEQKIKELEDFIARFSANASKSKQATSRKKSLEKIELEEILPSNRKYPFINFTLNRELGKDVLTVDNLSKEIDGVKVLNNISFAINKDDKIVLLGDDIAKTTLLKILVGEIEPDSGTYKWGQTVEYEYLPLDISGFFEHNNQNLVEFLRPYSKDQTESYIRGFLGRMLFSGDDSLKKVNVLSGGEKMRLMFSKIMIKEVNFLLLDQPINHLDLESIQALNDGLIKYRGGVIFTSNDYHFINTTVNRVMEITKSGIFNIETNFEDYINDENVQVKLKKMNNDD